MIEGWIALVGTWFVNAATIIVAITWFYAYNRVRITPFAILGLATIAWVTGLLYLDVLNLLVMFSTNTLSTSHPYTPLFSYSTWISLGSRTIFAILAIWGIRDLFRTFKGKQVVSGD